MLDRILNKINWYFKYFIKEVYYFLRILLFPYKKISGVLIPLKNNWAFTVKDHIIRGDYETGELNIISKTINSNDRILEIGSGLGFLAIYCAQKIGLEKIVSFEANP